MRQTDSRAAIAARVTVRDVEAAVTEDPFCLPAEVRDGLDRARTRARKATGGRLRAQMGEDWVPIVAFDAAGFEVPLTALAEAPNLRGLVEIHEGPRMVSTVLVVAAARTGDRMRYEFKRATPARTEAPVDYEQEGAAPAGYLTRR